MDGFWNSAGGFAFEKVGGRKVMGAILMIGLVCFFRLVLLYKLHLDCGSIEYQNVTAVYQTPNVILA
jgi:hypothetical protein